MEITGQNQAQPQINVTDQNPQVQSFTPPPTQEVPVKPKPSFPKSIFILIVLLILIMGSGVFYFIKYFGIK